jgi:hypothetical protein
LTRIGLDHSSVDYSASDTAVGEHSIEYEIAVVGLRLIDYCYFDTAVTEIENCSFDSVELLVDYPTDYQTDLN